VVGLQWVDCCASSSRNHFFDTAHFLIKMNHVTKTRHAHQVMAASLYALLHLAYAEYHTSVTEIEKSVVR